MWSNLYMIRINNKAFIFAAIFIVIFIWYYFTNNSHHLTHFLVAKNTINLKSLLIASIVTAQLGGEQVVKVYNSNYLHIQSKGKTKEGANDMLTRADIQSHTIMVQTLSTVYPNLKIISEERSMEDEEFDQIDLSTHFKKIKAKLNSEEFSMFSNDMFVPISELTVWIDPLDATYEYTQKLVNYVTTMVCVAQKGVPIIGIIYKPFQNQTYWGFNKHVSSNFKSYTQSTVSTNNSFRILVSRSHAGDIKQLIENSFNKNIEIIEAAGAGYKIIELVNGNADAYIHNTLIKKWDICAPNSILNSIDSGMLTTLKGKLISYGSDEVFVNNGILATVNKDHYRIIKLLNGANEK